METIKDKLDNYGLDLLKTKKRDRRDKFWYNNITILVNKDRLDEFIPTKEMSLNEKLNATVRLLAYISALLFLLTQNYNYLCIFVFGLIFTFLIYRFSNNKNKKNIEKYYPHIEKNVNYVY